MNLENVMEEEIIVVKVACVLIFFLIKKFTKKFNLKADLSAKISDKISTIHMEMHELPKDSRKLKI